MAYRVNYRGGQGFNLGPIGFLIVANLILFILTTFKPEWIDNLALNRYLFLVQPWTLLTSMFVHSGFFHILFNMFTLYIFGNFFVRLLGENKLLFVYFVGGIIGGILFLLTSTYSRWALGASGGIFAVVGTIVLLKPKMTVFIIPIPAPIPLWIAVVGFTVLSFLPGIAWQAHLGGLVFGLGAGYLFRRKPRFLY